MKKTRTIIILAIVLSGGPTLVMADWWVEGVGGSAQQLSGFSRFGPYPTREAAEAANRQYLNGQGTVTGSDAANGTATSLSPGDALAVQAARQLGEDLHKVIFGDPQAEAQRLNEQGLQYYNNGQWQAAVNAFGAALGKWPGNDTIRQNLKRAKETLARFQQGEDQRRAAEEARKRQEQYNRLSSLLTLESSNLASGGLDSQLKLGDAAETDDGLRPQGTSFFGLGGGTGGSIPIGANNNTTAVDSRPRQGYSAEAAAPANPASALPLILGDQDATSRENAGDDTKTLFDKGTRDSAPVDTRVNGPSKLDAAVLPVASPPVESLSGKAEPMTTAPQAGVPDDLVKEFLFPGKPPVFPKNPNPPLLNILAEQAKAKNLPLPGENADAFAARFLKSDLFRQLSDADNALHPWNEGPVYPHGKYPEVDKYMDEKIQLIVDQELAGIQTASRTAVERMNAEYANMEKQGIIQPGDDLAAKEKTDVVYQDAIMHARHRVFEQFENDVRGVLIQHDGAVEQLKADIPKLQDANKSDVEKYLFPGNKQ